MDVNNTPVESSPAANEAPTSFELPKSSGPEYVEWRKTGKLPEKPKQEPPKKEAPAASKESSDEGTQASGEAPASEPGNQQQERKPKSNAETRLNELLNDLRRAGLSPAELKTFKREAQQAAKTEQPQAPPEKTEQPAATDDGPKEPNPEDFKTWDEYQAALRKYSKELTQHEVKKAIEADRAQRRMEEAQREMQSKLTSAKQRYGDEAEGTIRSSAQEIMGDQNIPAAVKQMLNESPVLMDVLYVMGSKAEEFGEFLESARSNPSQAIRKLVLVEKLVQEELAGKTTAAPAHAESGDGGQPQRDASGKFVKGEAPPAKQVTKAPPPPREASGRAAAPADEVEGAAKDGDFARYRAAANRRDLARRQGR
jgi:hypothetical protein